MSTFSSLLLITSSSFNELGDFTPLIGVGGDCDDSKSVLLGVV